MQLFLYEHITATGQGEESLMREGDAMVRALAADFATLPKMNVLVPRSSKLPSLSLGPRVQCLDLKLEADTTPETIYGKILRERISPDFCLTVAPETDNVLVKLAFSIDRITKCNLNSSIRTIFMGGNKSIWATVLSDFPKLGPRSWWKSQAGAAEFPEDWPFPSVVKPFDGAGSQGVRKIETREEFDPATLAKDELIQTFIPGLPVSAACICNQKRIIYLEPAIQQLGGKSGFEYLGGKLPLDPPLASRAKLALAKVLAIMQRMDALPRGYIGVDMVLGESADGSQDYIIEVNPRITTSYVGLRKFYKGNLAAAMIDVVQGREPKLAPRKVEVEWDAAGNVTVTEMK